jgi:hypothetical protein
MTLAVLGTWLIIRRPSPPRQTDGPPTANERAAVPDSRLSPRQLQAAAVPAGSAEALASGSRAPAVADRDLGDGTASAGVVDAAAMVQRSPISHDPIEVTIDNTCDREIEVWWVDLDGKEQRYGRLRPGKIRTMPTFDGHLWRLKSPGDDQVLSSFVSRPGLYVEPCAAGSAHRLAERPAEAAPRDPPTKCSETGGAPMTLHVANQCEGPVELVWVEFDCSLNSYRKLKPGERHAQRTFARHVWRLVDTDERTLVELTADAEHDQLVACGAP